VWKTIVLLALMFLPAVMILLGLAILQMVQQ
jgi:hypothetical protein